MRTFLDCFFVNGKPMLASDEEVAVVYTDLDSDESGRDESGVAHRIVIRYKLGTWSFIFKYITEEEKRYMENLFPDEPDFEFTHPDRIEGDKLVNSRCYRSNYGIAWKNMRTGLHRNYKFNIIEC